MPRPKKPAIHDGPIPRSEVTRARIQTSMLLTRLHNHAAGKVNMSATQVRAAEILLKKSLPDLTSTEIRGEMTIEGIRVVFVDS